MRGLEKATIYRAITAISSLIEKVVYGIFILYLAISVKVSDIPGRTMNRETAGFYKAVNF